MKNRTKALTALAVGAMLVGASGSTFALWQQTATIDIPSIHTGDFGVRFTQGFEWDAVALTADHGVESTLTATATVTPSLIGTNLAGNMRLESDFDASQIAGQPLSVAAEFDFNGRTHKWADFPNSIELGTLTSAQPVEVRVYVEKTDNPDGHQKLTIDLGKVTAVLQQARS